MKKLFKSASAFPSHGTKFIWLKEGPLDIKELGSTSGVDTLEVKAIGKLSSENLGLFLRERCNSGMWNPKEAAEYINNPNMAPVGDFSMGTRNYNKDAEVASLYDPEDADWESITVVDIRKLEYFDYQSVSGSTLRFKKNHEDGFDVYGGNLGINTTEYIEELTGVKLNSSFINKKEFQDNLDRIENQRFPHHHFDSEEEKQEFIKYLKSSIQDRTRDIIHPDNQKYLKGKAQLLFEEELDLEEAPDADRIEYWKKEN